MPLIIILFFLDRASYSVCDKLHDSKFHIPQLLSHKNRHPEFYQWLSHC